MLIDLLKVVVSGRGGTGGDPRPESNRGLSAFFFQPNALPLCQTGSQPVLVLRFHLCTELQWFLSHEYSASLVFFASLVVPAGSPSRGGDVMVYVTDINPPSLLSLFFVLFCSCVCFCLYCPFNSISFHKFSRQLFAFSLCSSGLISALLGLSTLYIYIITSALI